MDELHVPQGTFVLERHPPTTDRSLRAWDAADELALHHLAESGIDEAAAIVIVNDAFGALATALSHHAPVVVSDSHLAHVAIRTNLERNGIDPATVRVIAEDAELPPHIDVLIVKVPKSLALLEDQLRAVAPRLGPASEVVGAGMVRHIHTSTLDVFTRTIGPVRTSRAQRKARLIHAVALPDLDRGSWPWPSRFRTTEDDVTVVSRPGVFSASALDSGTRLLLQHVPRGTAATRIVDLGCGNGVVGATAQRRNPAARITFVDESHRAVASAAATYDATFGSAGTGSATTATPPPSFVVADGLTDLGAVGVEAGSIDLVLTNPPFHLGHAVDRDAPQAMFAGARTALRSGGELWVVGNRHLRHDVALRRLFGSADVVASTPKFVLVRATRR